MSGALRINKFISETGFCSRREADKLVESGRITINGKLAELGSQAELGDDVRVDNVRIGEQKEHVYIALNKPVGITSTTEAQIEGNTVDYVNTSGTDISYWEIRQGFQGLILLKMRGYRESDFTRGGQA